MPVDPATDTMSDFCLWGPQQFVLSPHVVGESHTFSLRPNSPIGNTEGEEVAWCTKPTHGARTIPAGAITGLQVCSFHLRVGQCPEQVGSQFIKTPSYVLVAGHLKQELLNLPADDYGGELDSGGQDLVRSLAGSTLNWHLTSTSARQPDRRPVRFRVYRV